MDIDAELRREHSKRQVRRMVEWVGNDPARFAPFVDRMLGPDRLLAQRASWVVGDCAECHPGLLGPHLVRMLDRLGRPALHDAVTRHTMRVLQFAAIPPRLEGRVMSFAMAALGGTAPIAVKAYALTVLKRLSERYPEILPELRALLAEILPDAGPALRSRARREFPAQRDLTRDH